MKAHKFHDIFLPKAPAGEYTLIVDLQLVGQPTTEKMEDLFVAAHGFFKQLSATAIKHKFIGKPLKIQIFHTKNTPVHWGKIHPIKQEYSLVQRKKFIG